MKYILFASVAFALFASLYAAQQAIDKVQAQREAAQAACLSQKIHRADSEAEVRRMLCDTGMGYIRNF
jgi:hypothetical protein